MILFIIQLIYYISIDLIFLCKKKLRRVRPILLQFTAQIVDIEPSQ